MNENEFDFVDGNAAAGALREVFAVDLTASIGLCSGCGTSAPLGTSHVYMHAPGIVVRCSHCKQPLLRMVKAPTAIWLDLRGLVSIQIALPDPDG